MSDADSNADRPHLDILLVRRLIATQFPEWAGLPSSRSNSAGGNNRTFHLGDDMTVRPPSAARYAAQVEKEHPTVTGPGATTAAAHSDPAGDGTPDGGLPLAQVGLPLARRRDSDPRAYRAPQAVCRDARKIPCRPAGNRRGRRAGTRPAQFLPRRPAGATTTARRGRRSQRSAAGSTALRRPKYGSARWLRHGRVPPSGSMATSPRGTSWSGTAG